jgi:hypothetical protein
LKRLASISAVGLVFEKIRVARFDSTSSLMNRRTRRHLRRGEHALSQLLVPQRRVGPLHSHLHLLVRRHVNDPAASPGADEEAGYLLRVPDGGREADDLDPAGQLLQPLHK